MSERMTDERLAEILAEGENWTSGAFRHSIELLQALKAERSYAELCDDQEADNRKHIKELKAKLANAHIASLVDGERIEALEYGLIKAVKAIQSLDIDALGIVQETHNCPAYPIRDALLHDLYPLIRNALQQEQEDD